MRRIISSAFVALLLVAPLAAQAGKIVNARCPVKTDQPAKPDLNATYHGVVVGFCCGNCKGKWAGDPDKYAANVPELKPILAKMEKDKEKAKEMTGPCDCKKIVKGYYCEKDKRELGPDDVRGNVCKRCEMKAAEIEYCLKLVPKPIDPKKKVQDPPAEDKARISYVCEKCGAKGEMEEGFKHKDDCKPSALGGGLKKVCAKSGHMPHATKAD
jgi:hypothetical protein